MKFDYTEEQQLVADSVRRFVAQDYSFEARKRIVASREGWSREVWAKLAQIGLLGMPFPADYGGFGARAVDLMSVMEAFGDALLVEPYLSTVGLAGRLVARAGSEEQRGELLPAVAEGQLVLAFAHLGEVTRSGSKLNGRKHLVTHAPIADKLVVSTADGLFLVDAKAAGLSLTPYTTLDSMRAADIEFRDVTAVRLGGGDARAALDEALDYATALQCAEAVGAMKSANDATLEYLKTRKQFGVPIGFFQALQHRMVDMVIECEQARSMASLACARVDSASSPGERSRIVSAAKIKIADAARRISQESVQLHGGMGMSDELKVSHTFRRLTVIAREFGDADFHLARFARC